MPCLGTIDKENGVIAAATHNQHALVVNPAGVLREVDAETFDSLCLAEEIHLIVKSAFPFGTGNRQIFLDKTGGESWMRVHMARAAIERAFPSDPEPADTAMVAVAHQAGNCWEHAMLSFALVSSSGIDRPVHAIYDDKDDHTYVLIGDFRKEPKHKIVVIDPSLLTPIAHTLADSTLHFPQRAEATVVASHDPAQPEHTKYFSVETAAHQKTISRGDIATYIAERNKDRDDMGMPPLPKEFGPEFVNLLTDGGDNASWLFEHRFSITNPDIVYQDKQGRERSFNTLPADYMQRFFETHIVDILAHFNKGFTVTRQAG